MGRSGWGVRIRESLGGQIGARIEGPDFSRRLSLAGNGHFDRVEDGALGLGFERGGACGPKWREGEAGIEDGGPVASPAFSEGTGEVGLWLTSPRLWLTAWQGLRDWK
ncbi:MAG: hypothetical protein RLZZ142_1344 [Verrucomicrobiota bacterium]